jgi:DNA polymerase III epsilon subunit-like protein
MSDSYYVAFDSETGGLNPASADMLTFYMAIVDRNFKILDEIDLKLKPDSRLPVAEEGALKVNGIDLYKHLADPGIVTYSEAKEKILVLLKKYLKKKGRYSNLTPLGQNVQFDIDWLQHHILPKEEYDKLLHYGKMDTKMITDFMKAATWLPPDLGSLDSLAKHFNVALSNAHNAKADTLATVEIYKKLLELMASRKDGGGQGVDLVSLLESE